MLRPAPAADVQAGFEVPGLTSLRPDPRNQAHRSHEEKQTQRRNNPARLRRNPAVLCAGLPADW